MAAGAPLPTARTGALLLGMGAFLFALTTVFAKMAIQSGGFSGIQLALSRAAIGCVYFGVMAILHKRFALPNRPDLNIARAIFNTLSLALFFLAIAQTSLTNANLLNMTSPIYIFLLAPWLGDGRPSWLSAGFLVLAFVGMILVVRPEFGHVNPGDVLGAISGVFGGLAIATLRKARQHDRASTILLWQMAIGTMLLLPWALLTPGVWVATAGAWAWLLLCGCTGVLAQTLLTIGYRYIDAARGSIISASQIGFAAGLGIVVFGERITWHTAVGGGLIALSLVGVSGLWRRWGAKPSPRT
jgi:drug/metabolite transporter (DMT)-like permease